MKRVLIVSYFFPPHNAIASRRWGGMVHTISQSYDVYVFTQHGKGDIQVPIHEQKIFRVNYLESNIELQKAYTHKNPLRLLISLLSAHINTIDSTLMSWFLKNINSFKELLKNINPDYIITSVGPFSTALFGIVSKSINPNIKWIVDIRDSMSLNYESQKNPFSKYIDRYIDKTVINQCDMILTVSPTLSQIFSKFYKKQVVTIYNGFDLPLINAPKSSHVNKQSKYQGTMLYYAGVIYPHQERAFNLFIDYIANKKEYIFKIRLLATKANYNRYQQYLKTNQINNVELLLPAHAHIIHQEESHADVLVLFEDLNKKSSISKGTLTGKLFEYLPFKAPILAICRDDSDIKEILRKTKRGQVLSHSSQLNEFFDNMNQYRLKHMSQVIEFSRSYQGKKVCNCLKKILVRP